MNSVNNKCILIVDMINDFVNGKFGNEEALKTVEKTEETLIKLNKKIKIIFAKDSHIKNDPEFKVWGEHAIDNSYSSEIVNELKEFPDYIIKKRHYDAFFDTDLDSLLRALNIKKMYIFGISTDICVLHTCAGAFYRYYDVSVVSDLCSSIDKDNHLMALKNIKINYGYNAISSEEFIKEVNENE